MTKNKRIIITALCLIGLALSIELCFVYYNANFAINAKPSICAINESMNCDGVAKTQYSQAFGVPLSMWGILLYLIFLFFTYIDKLQNLKFMSFFKIFKNPSSYIFCIGLLSFILSMILGSISIFAIHSICIFCFMTYFIDLLIAITSKTKGISIAEEIKISFKDFIDAVKQKKYLISLLTVILIAASILTYTSITNVLAPQVAERKAYNKELKSYEHLANGYELGSKDANVVVHEYIDFNCGGCYLANVYLHRIVNEFSNVKVIQHNVPLDIQCNKNMQHEGHKNSCLKTSYALAAEKQNKYWQMADILFQKGPQTEEEILEQAKSANFDINKLKEDAHSDKIKKEIEDSIADADSKDVVGTPTLYIGIRKLMGVGSYLELKQIIIQSGGKEKVGN